MCTISRNTSRNIMHFAQHTLQFYSINCEIHINLTNILIKLICSDLEQSKCGLLFIFAQKGWKNFKNTFQLLPFEPIIVSSYLDQIDNSSFAPNLRIVPIYCLLLFYFCVIDIVRNSCSFVCNDQAFTTSHKQFQN